MWARAGTSDRVLLLSGSLHSVLTAIFLILEKVWPWITTQLCTRWLAKLTVRVPNAVTWTGIIDRLILCWVWIPKGAVGLVMHADVWVAEVCRQFSTAGLLSANFCVQHPHQQVNSGQGHAL